MGSIIIVMPKAPRGFLYFYTSFKRMGGGEQALDDYIFRREGELLPTSTK